MRITSAELRWGGDGSDWCDTVPGLSDAQAAPELLVGSERVEAESTSRDGGGYRSRADVTARLPELLAPDGRTVVVRGLWHGFAQDCWNDWSLHVTWSSARPAVDVHTTAHRPAARPGEQLEQSAEITNTGDVPLEGITAELTAGQCRRSHERLTPGERTTVTCAGAMPEDGRLRATVRARSAGGTPVAADAGVRVRVLPPPQEQITRAVPAPPPPPPPPQEPRPVRAQDDPGVLRESPERVAGVIAILGVLVMTVTVGALSAATRAG